MTEDVSVSAEHCGSKFTALAVSRCLGPALEPRPGKTALNHLVSRKLLARTVLSHWSDTLLATPPQEGSLSFL